MTLRSTTLTLAMLAGLAAAPAGAAAAPPSLSLTTPATASTGSELPVGVNASFTDGANGSQALTLFLIRPGAGGCPASGVAPSGAEVLLSREPADQVLIVSEITSKLSVPGSWTVCAYLGASGAVTASASQAVAVSGAPMAQAVVSKVKKHHKHHAKTKHSKKTTKP
jgi:hypothetical protein